MKNSNNRECATCPTCGHTSITYRFGFNKALATFLIALYEAGGPVKTDSLGLTYAQRTNSQKLRYWGLAVPYMVPGESTTKRGWWQITAFGKEFVEGRISIPRFAYTKDGDVVKHDGKVIYFSEVEDGYKYRDHYQSQAADQHRGEQP